MPSPERSVEVGSTASSISSPRNAEVLRSQFSFEARANDTVKTVPVSPAVFMDFLQQVEKPLGKLASFSPENTELYSLHATLQAQQEELLIAYKTFLSQGIEGKAVNPSPNQQRALLRKSALFLESRNSPIFRLFSPQRSSYQLPQFLIDLDLSPSVVGASTVLTELSVILPTQFDVARSIAADTPEAANVDPRNVARDAHEILQSIIQQRLTLHSILDCVDDAGALKTDHAPFVMLLRSAKMSPGIHVEEFQHSDILAARFFVAYVAKYIQEIKEYSAASKRDYREMLVVDALGVCTRSHAFVHSALDISTHVVELLKTGTFDLGTFVRHVAQSSSTYKQAFAHAALRPLYDRTEQESSDDVLAHDAAVVMNFCMTGDAASKQVRQADVYANAHLTIRQQQLVRALIENVASQDMLGHLLQSCDIPTEQDRRTSLHDREAAAILEDLVLRGRLSIRNAFEMYYLRNTPGTRPMISQKVIQILSEQNPEVAQVMQVRLLRSYYDLARKYAKGEDLSPLVKKWDLDAKTEVELRNVGEALSRAGVAQLEGWWNRTQLTFRYFPVEVTAILFAWKGVPFGVAATGFALKGNAWRHQWRLSAVKSFTNLSVGKLKELHPNLQKFSDDFIRMCQDDVRGLITEYDRLCFRTLRSGTIEMRETAIAMFDAVKGTKDMQAYADALSEYFKNPQEVAKRLLAAYPNEAEKIEKILTSERYGMEAAHAKKILDQIAAENPALRIAALEVQNLQLTEALLTQRYKALLQRIDSLPPFTSPHRLSALEGIETEAKELQQALDMHIRKLGDSSKAAKLRRTLAEMAVGSMSDTQFSLLERVHTSSILTPTQKQRLLINSASETPVFTSRQALKLLRCGLAGTPAPEPPVAIVEQIEDLPASKNVLNIQAPARSPATTPVTEATAVAEARVAQELAEAAETKAIQAAALKGLLSLAAKGLIGYATLQDILAIGESDARLHQAVLAGRLDDAALLQDERVGRGLSAAANALTLVAPPMALATIPATVAASSFYASVLDMNAFARGDYKKESTMALLSRFSAKSKASLHLADVAISGKKGQEIRSSHREDLIGSLLWRAMTVPLAREDFVSARQAFDALPSGSTHRKNPAATLSRLAQEHAAFRGRKAQQEAMTYLNDQFARNTYLGVKSLNLDITDPVAFRNFDPNLFDTEDLQSHEGRAAAAMRIGGDVASMFALRGQLQREGKPLRIEFSTSPGRTETLDLTKLQHEPGKEGIATIDQLIPVYRRYHLFNIRANSLVVHQLATAPKEDLDASTERQLLKRLVPSIAAAEARLRQEQRPGAIVGMLESMSPREDLRPYYVQASLFELRRMIVTGTKEIADTMQNSDVSLDMIIAMEQRLRDRLNTITTESLFDTYMKKQSEPYNPLISMLKERTGISGAVNRMTMRTIGDEVESILQPLKKMQDSTGGVPLERCVSVLIDG